MDLAPFIGAVICVTTLVLAFKGKKAIETAPEEYDLDNFEADCASEVTIQLDEVETDDGTEDMLTPQLTESYLTLENYVGQTRNVEYLLNHVRKSKATDKPLPHIVLWGSGGLGKSTLLKAAADHMGGRFFELVPANLKTSKELFGVFFRKECPACHHYNPYSTNRCLECRESISIYFTPRCSLKNKDIVFFEECHGLREDIEEAMYSLMQDGYMMVRYNGIDQKVTFPNITIAGATTQLGQLKKPFRDRFKLQLKLEHYTQDEMKQIIKMYAESRGLTIDESGLEILARISHGVPRVAKNRLGDAETLSNDITTDEIQTVMRLLRLDENGLDDTHHKGMRHILARMKVSKNGGAGSASIASSLGVPKIVWEELFEPALLYQDMIFMGSRGRRLTSKALEVYYATEKSEVK